MNQGIIHLAFKPGGKPFCNTRRSIMSTTPEAAKSWPRVCAKCEAIHRKREEREKAAKEAKRAEDLEWLNA